TIAREAEVQEYLLNALDEQLDRIGVSDRVARFGVWQRERLQHVRLFAGNSQGLAAGGDDRDALGFAQGGVGESRACADEVLAVVQPQQELALLEIGKQRVGGRFACLLFHPEYVSGSAGDERRFSNRSEVYEPHAIVVGIEDFGGGLKRESRLADSPDAVD